MTCSVIYVGVYVYDRLRENQCRISALDIAEICVLFQKGFTGHYSYTGKIEGMVSARTVTYIICYTFFLCIYNIQQNI